MADHPPRASAWLIDVGAVLLLAAITAGAGLLVVRPALTVVQDRAHQRDVLRGRGEEAAKLQQSLIALRRQLGELEQTVEGDPARLQRESEKNQQLARLGDLAAACQLQLDELVVQPVRDDGEYRVVPIRVSARGGYVEAARFLHRLREAMPAVTVESFDLTGNPRRDDVVPTISMRLMWIALPDRTR